jgi:uncharacterized protein DUF6220
MRKFFAALATLLLLAVLAQFFLAATGAFDTADKEEAFGPHKQLGYAVLLYAVLVTVVAAVARVPGRLIGLSGLVAGLALLQGVIRQIARAFDDGASSTAAGEILFGLHAINALAILAVAGMLFRESRELAKSPALARQAT